MTAITSDTPWTPNQPLPIDPTPEQIFEREEYIRKEFWPIIEEIDREEGHPYGKLDRDSVVVGMIFGETKLSEQFLANQENAHFFRDKE